MLSYALSMTQMSVPDIDVSAQTLIMRLERLPVTSWHVRARMIVGAATFFDAFDVLTISIALPVLPVQWRLNPGEIGAQ